MKKIIFITCILLTTKLFSQLSFADEGMWLPQLIKKLNEGDLKKIGFKLSAEDIYSINKSSLKDAIGHFNGGCTSELVSAEGLLLTNHHCGYDQIQSHSTVTNNYLRDGFWAKSKGEEIPCPGLTVSFIVKIEDVSKQMLAGIDKSLSEEDRNKKLEENAKKIETEAVVGNKYQAKVRSFFYGNEFYLFTSEIFKDVRLVGAPPESVGKFGGDTDNWMWPRHTGDFSVFRIYANENNEAVDYSPSNKPYTPKKFLNISLKGYKEKDFTLTYGFPGRTFQYLTTYGIKQVSEISNPNNIAARSKRLDTWAMHMRADEKVQLQYSSKFASISNYYKKFQGENKGMRVLNTMQYKQNIENDFQAWANKGSNDDYKNILPKFKDTYEKLYPLQLETDLYRECGLAVEAINLANAYNNLIKIAKDEKITDDVIKVEIEKLKKRNTLFFKNYDLATDKEIFVNMLDIYIKKSMYALELTTSGLSNLKQAADQAYSNSMFVDASKLDNVLNAFNRKNTSAIEQDEIWKYMSIIVNNYNVKVKDSYIKHANQIELLNRTWVAGLREMQPSKSFWPDANSTLRVSYGTIKGYKPFDGAYYNNTSYLSGIIEKMDNTNPEFMVPEKIYNLYKAKDFGQYADKTGDVPVAFIATNHTTGGNSGSPLLDSKGNLLGLNFDTAWEGTVSNYHFSEIRVRNISVDIRYVLFIIDKYAGATNLINEMTLIK